MLMMQAKAQRRGLPKKLADLEDKIEPWMEFYLVAFEDLMTEAASGFGLGPIPWSKILRYAEVHGIRGSDYHDFRHIIRKMESVHHKKGEDSGSGNSEGSKS
jgi:hypothetical protein